MNQVAFVFSSAPYGKSSGREGLDALLATSALSGRVGVFFIGDGVFQILNGQRSSIVLARNYIATFNVLSFYDIKDIFICTTSMQERGLKENLQLILDVKYFSSKAIRDQLSNYNVILTF